MEKSKLKLKEIKRKNCIKERARDDRNLSG